MSPYVVIRPTDPYVDLAANTALSEQFADKPTRGQSIHGLVNSQTGQLADSKVFLIHGKIITYLYTVAPTPWGTGARSPTFTNDWARGHSE